MATLSRILGVAVVLTVWFLAVLAAGSAGAFQSTPSQPPLPILVALAVPPLLFAVVYRAVPGFRRVVLAIDLRFLTALQAWRVIGIMFLALYAFDLLPGLFAWPAGVGDMAVGLAAPFVVLAMLRGSATWPRQVAWLNIAGLVDFAGAFATGILTSQSALGVFASDAARAHLDALPLSLVPTFAVPLWIICHIISLLQLRRLSAAGGTAVSIEERRLAQSA